MPSSHTPSTTPNLSGTSRLSNVQPAPASTAEPDTPRFLQRDGGRIAYSETGAGPLVVSVPGMGDLRSTFRHLAPHLVAAGMRVAAMDLRGHGDSDATFDAYDDEAAASDVIALIEHLGGPAVVVGNSMGAGAAVLAAARRPDLVRGLVVIGPFVRDVPTSAVKRWMFRLAFGGPWARRAWISFLPRLYPTRRTDDFTAHRARIAAAIAKPGHRRAFQATTHTSHAPAEAVLESLQLPALVVMGSLDPDFADPAGEAALIGERIGAEVVLVPEAGHYPHAEFPDVTGPAVADFVRRLAAGSTNDG